MVFVRTDKDDRHTAATASGTTATGAIATGAIATGAIATATATATGTVTVALGTARVMPADFSVRGRRGRGRDSSGGDSSDDQRGALREVENAQQQLHGAGRARAGKEHHVVLAAPDALRNQLARLGSAGFPEFDDFGRDQTCEFREFRYL